MTPLLLGVAGVFIGRKTKTTVDQIKYKELIGRVSVVEQTQAGHVIAIATMQATIIHLQDQFDRIEDTVETNCSVTMEMRGMLCQALGIQPQPMQFKSRRPRPVVPPKVVAVAQEVLSQDEDTTETV